MSPDHHALVSGAAIYANLSFPRLLYPSMHRPPDLQACLAVWDRVRPKREMATVRKIGKEIISEDSWSLFEPGEHFREKTR